MGMYPLQTELDTSFIQFEFLQPGQVWRRPASVGLPIWYLQTLGSRCCSFAVLFTSHDGWLVLLMVDVTATLCTFGFSVMTDNSSIYDPY